LKEIGPCLMLISVFLSDKVIVLRLKSENYSLFFAKKHLKIAVFQGFFHQNSKLKIRNPK